MLNTLDKSQRPKWVATLHSFVRVASEIWKSEFRDADVPRDLNNSLTNSLSSWNELLRSYKKHCLSLDIDK
jgi:hypothetical protein